MGDIELKELEQNLPETPPLIFQNIAVWRSIEQYMNPLMSTSEQRHNAALYYHDNFAGEMMPVPGANERQSIVDEIRHIHHTMMFIRRLGGLPMFRQPRR